MWARLMVATFIFNGLCNFGLRILAGMGLGKEFTGSYLVFWYLGGAVLMIAAATKKLRWPSRQDLLIGVSLAGCSAMGQNTASAALDSGVPGNVVYPIAYAGGLFIVAVVGILAFRERVGRCGAVGICLGIASIILLALEQ